MTCLLCPAAAVQDALCVPCGAKLWAAKEWEERPADAQALCILGNAPPGLKDRWIAVALMRSSSARLGFFAALESCRLQREIHELQKNRGKKL